MHVVTALPRTVATVNYLHNRPAENVKLGSVEGQQ